MKKLLGLALILSASFSLNLALAASATTHSTPVQDVPLLRLGDGYTSYDYMSVGEPALKMELTSVTYGDLQSSIFFNSSISAAQLARDLNVNLSAGGGWGWFSGSAAANYVRHTQNTNYSENFTYEQQFYANALLDVSQLPSGMGALSTVAAGTYQSGIVPFTTRYGDQFIQQLPMGAILLVNVQLNFNSLLDKQNFDAAVGGGIGSIFSASAKIQNAVSQSKSQGSIEISAYQSGGDPTQLANIFKQSPGGGYYFTSCSLTNLADCNQAINGVINYAQNDFSHQIAPPRIPGRGLPPEGNLSVVGPPMLQYYTGKFGLLPAPPLPQPVYQARNFIGDFLLEDQLNTYFTSHLLNAPFANRYTADVSTGLRTIQQNLTWNLNLFNSMNAFNCYLPGQENTCPTIMGNIANNRRPVDQNLLEIMNEAYFLNIPSSYSIRFYPLGDGQFIGIWLYQNASVTGAASSLNFASDMSSVSVYTMLYPDPSTDPPLNVKFIGALPRVSQSTYSGNLEAWMWLYGHGWSDKGTYAATLTQINNPL